MELIELKSVFSVKYESEGFIISFKKTLKHGTDISISLLRSLLWVLSQWLDICGVTHQRGKSGRDSVV